MSYPPNPPSNNPGIHDGHKLLQLFQARNILYALIIQKLRNALHI